MVHGSRVGIGDRIRIAREFRGISMNELGKRSGLGKSVISRLEAGQQGPTGPGMTTIERIAGALDVRAGWLFTEEGGMELVTDPVPRRALATAIAREAGWLDGAIQAVLALNVPNAEDRTTVWWIDAIRARDALLRQEAELAADDPEESMVRKRSRPT